MAQGYMDSLLRTSTKVNRGSSGNVETNIGQTEMPDPGEDKARFDLWRQLSEEQRAKLLNEAKLKQKTDAQKFQEGKARQDKRTQANLKAQSDLKEKIKSKQKKDEEAVAKAEKKKIDKVQSERDKIKLEFVPYKRKLAQSNDEIDTIQRQIDGLDDKYEALKRPSMADKNVKTLRRKERKEKEAELKELTEKRRLAIQKRDRELRFDMEELVLAAVRKYNRDMAKVEAEFTRAGLKAEYDAFIQSMNQ
jgi:chromosome segregation ATPase|tara:strand:+ start:2008 stop:2754 length:747 start_codon:yes stop_codon:yes gene_type:complete